MVNDHLWLTNDGREHLIVEQPEGES